MKLAWCLLIVVVLSLVLGACAPQTPEQIRHNELWERGVLFWKGRVFSADLLAKDGYGKGTYTNRTNNAEGWVYFPWADVTFVYNKSTRIIQKCHFMKMER